MYAFSISRIYREAYGLFVSNGILFNHESPRRGETFVTRKITRHVAKYAKGFREVLHLGSLDSVRDWGHAKDYVEGMHLILQHHKPDDFVLATGIGRTVREFTEVVFSLVGVHIVWDKSGEHEIGLDSESKAVLVKSEASYLRPLEVPILIGDATKALKELNWSPKISFEDMVKEMLEHDSLILNTNFN
jgi:GDPmannose 4,6-dehydratase